MILVFGSINLDIIYQLDELPRPGQTVIGRTALVQPGGKGANQAVAAARDGAVVAMAGAIGGDPMAEAAMTGLRDAGVDLSRVSTVDLPTGSASICVDRHGENQIAVASGANLRVVAGQVADADLGPDTILVLQMEVPAEATGALIRRAKARGARIILNLAPAGPIAEDALAMVDWLVVNAEEAAWLAGHLSVSADPASLHAGLGVGIVNTLGAEGVLAHSDTGAVLLRANSVAVVDATGAGDCFIGVFAAALDRGESVKAALERANVAAGLSCTRRGSQASLPSSAETDEVLRTCSQEVLSSKEDPPT
ncbi:ribokinase [Acidisphaera sp. L21]|uniref:ribokinase n=1 Tax=Acidisphaera sp. L21 TaxID=1641851 RepID=UPI00131C384C|nr:ribokinase [Acidisphaera sp. L21]